MLCNIPDDAKINLVREGVALGPDSVRGKYSQLRPLALVVPELRGWTLDVLKVARSLGKAQFSLGELYVKEVELKQLHPRITNIRPKIRQQLQKLRDLNLIEFIGDGSYRFRETTKL